MTNYKKVNEIISYIYKELNNLYPKEEIKSFISLIFEHVLNYSKTDIHLNELKIIPAEYVKKIIDIIGKLKRYQPIQYIIGHTYFYDIKIKVSTDVLIPRPETEELVDWIISENKKNKLRIIDIGTGSGCIAIALSKNLNDTQTDATDISQKTLNIAKENAIFNNVKINFYNFDILFWQDFPLNNKYDIIVSNPPYVREADKKLMKANVLEFEPHSALFVPDTNPLIFYETIADFAIKYLKNNGKLYFEINELLSTETIQLLKRKGFAKTELKKDINGKFRMIKAVYKNDVAN
ncbi:MAG: peptide chain release factor N(5)-glutamine methyltransferase [Bacteroidales bacterium]|nr:peptide chain release factor N(5)-glutamine methyltransferase [Bacteroidales bacterium]